jgi:hypothetical protein
MKRWWMIGMAALALTLGLSVGSGALRAVSGSDTPTTGQRLEGTWLVTANLDSAPPGVPLTILTLQTFLPDGAFFESPPPTTRRGPIGHGQWVRAGDRLFTATFRFLTYDGQGQQTGMQQITSTIRLSEDLQAFRAVTRNEQFDLDGTLVFSGTATGTAQRLAIGDPPPAP